MRVAITGDRWWGRLRKGESLADERLYAEKTQETAVIYQALGTLDPETDFAILGDALGADTAAHRACEEYGIPHRVHEANWKLPKGAGGPVRNTAMLDDLGKESLLDPEPREVWYFHKDLPSSKGTKNCVEQARKRGIIVRNGMEVGK